jgi:hypothetical protein
MRCATSPTLSDWDVRDTGPLMYLAGVIFGGGKFVACGYGGAIQTSPDGLNWTPAVFPIVAWLRSVAFANNMFVAVGESGAIVSSPNGTDWTKRHAVLGTVLHDVAFGADTWVAVGRSGLILQTEVITGSEPGKIVLTQPSRAGSQFGFKFNSVAGKAYQVEASSDLESWAKVQDVVGADSTTSVTLSGQAQAAGFYRVTAQ